MSFLFLFVSDSWASSPSLGLVAICNSIGCSAQQQSEYLKALTNQCEIEKKILNCDGLVEDEPTLAPLIRQCSGGGICAQEMDYQRDKGKACLRGYANSLIDSGIALKDMAVSMAEGIDRSWEEIKNNEKVRSEFMTQCNQSLSCKRELVKDDPRYTSMSDEELNKVSATALFVQVQDRKGYVQSMQRSVPNTVPPTAHPEDYDLDAEHRVKLMNLAALMEAKLAKQVQKFACYTPKARVEMVCYAIGSVVDPTLLALAAFKGARAAGAVVKLSKEWTRARFIQKYLKYNPTSAEQNAKWVELAKKPKSPDTFFMSVENTQLKALNDVNKNLATSLTNFHKQLMITKLEELQKAYPDLKIVMSSDWKSLNIAFTGKIPPDLQEKLTALYADVNKEFTAYLRENKILRSSDNPETFFSGGFGTTSDEANAVMRWAREKPGTMLSYNDAGVTDALSGSIRAANIERQALQRTFGNTRVFDGNTPSADTFALLRKYKDPQKLKAALQQRYNISISDADVASLQRYQNNVDTYSLNPYPSVRESANLNDATQGGASVDFVGLGAQNLKGTADALAKSNGVNEGLVNSRKAEQAVTRDLNQQKVFLNKVLDESVGKGKLKTTCSGDDCVAVAVSPLKVAEKQKILNRLADSKYTSKVRFSFVNSGVRSAEARSALGAHGETMEKLLRKNLLQEFSSQKMDSLTFGVDMLTTDVNQGPVKLLIGQGQDLYLTKAEQKRIQNIFKQTVDQFNQSLKTKKVPAARYEASP